MAIIMERRLLLYTARGAGGGGCCTPSLSEKLMIRYHKTRGGHVKMEWPPIQFPSAFILIVRSLALIPGMHHTLPHEPHFPGPGITRKFPEKSLRKQEGFRFGIRDVRKQATPFSGDRSEGINDPGPPGTRDPAGFSFLPGRKQEQACTWLDGRPGWTGPGLPPGSIPLSSGRNFPGSFPFGAEGTRSERLIPEKTVSDAQPRRSDRASPGRV